MEAPSASEAKAGMADGGSIDGLEPSFHFRRERVREDSLTSFFLEEPTSPQAQGNALHLRDGAQSPQELSRAEEAVAVAVAEANAPEGAGRGTSIESTATTRASHAKSLRDREAGLERRKELLRQLEEVEEQIHGGRDRTMNGQAGGGSGSGGGGRVGGGGGGGGGGLSSPRSAKPMGQRLKASGVVFDVDQGALVPRHRSRVRKKPKDDSGELALVPANTSRQRQYLKQLRKDERRNHRRSRRGEGGSSEGHADPSSPGLIEKLADFLPCDLGGRLVDLLPLCNPLDYDDMVYDDDQAQDHESAARGGGEERKERRARAREPGPVQNASHFLSC